ncbi:hypothetical protein COU20_01715 [Candidatus Kaiserbacteria bacterium CG10_big_fil_rev_8_21_14_0_10_59_10]|uniref:Uncharacterized protein n=1 Tax=Candidatus Kaiserbacteria bacterium CG10_big_fil_rev_8_21_14_0_10_59_10 TaxID=1974612 RepID=A0A2H0U825_9BACT|nr:MAG: hypothetical protein COU20_01715 [Candidatus Kaiserbacteria bacterium CG10_big_fil_rev_8_21_14_0_10_59_10]
MNPFSFRVLAALVASAAAAFAAFVVVVDLQAAGPGDPVPPRAQRCQVRTQAMTIPQTNSACLIACKQNPESPACVCGIEIQPDGQHCFNPNLGGPCKPPPGVAMVCPTEGAKSPEEQKGEGGQPPQLPKLPEKKDDKGDEKGKQTECLEPDADKKYEHCKTRNPLSSYLSDIANNPLSETLRKPVEQLLGWMNGKDTDKDADGSADGSATNGSSRVTEQKQAWLPNVDAVTVRPVGRAEGEETGAASDAPPQGSHTFVAESAAGGQDTAGIIGTIRATLGQIANTIRGIFGL